jgi:Ca-activated chloride channel family protein
MLGVMGNLMNGNNCTMLQLGLNSPIVASPDQRPPLTVAVVVDVSGSMNAEGKIQFVRQGLGQLVNALNDDDRVALITYSDAARVAFPMADVRGRRNDLQRIVGNLQADGGTNLYDGLERGYQEVFDHYDSGRQNRVIFLSDGEPTIGNTDPETIMGMSRGYNSDGVGITSIGLGTSFNYALMRGIAEQGDGNFYFLEDAGAVEEVFTQEIAYFTVPVAFDLHLEVTAGSDYRILRAQGSSFWEATPEGGRLEVPSVFLAHRVSHDDQTPSGGRRGGGSALLLELMPRVDAPDDRETPLARVAHVDVSFREPGTNEIVRDTVDVTYPDAPWILRPEGFFDNAIVTKSFVMLNIFVTLQMACDLFHVDRDPAGAFQLLRRVIAAARDYEDSANDGAGDEDIRADIELMERLAQVIVNNSRQPEPEPEEMPEDPWPAD